MIAANNKIVRCCVQCSECGDCYTHTLYELRDLMLAIHVEVANYAKAFVQKINWGYGCASICESEVDELLTLNETIRRFYDGIRTKGMLCLCDQEFQKIKERIGKIIDLVKCSRTKEAEIFYDHSHYDQWVAENPYCVSYDAWEKSLVACNPPSFTISASKEQKVARTLFTISAKDSSGCVLKFLAYAHKAKCENKFTVSAKDMARCKVELNALVKAHNCNLTLAAYSKLLGCNLSFNVISSVLRCGGKFVEDATGAPMLKVGAKSSKVDDIVKLAGGTWQDMNEEEFNSIYG